MNCNECKFVETCDKFKCIDTADDGRKNKDFEENNADWAYSRLVYMEDWDNWMGNYGFSTKSIRHGMEKVAIPHKKKNSNKYHK